MTKLEKIVELANSNNGVITTNQVVEAGISRGILKYAVNKGYLERADRGVYTLPDAWEDDFVSMQTRYKRGIYSLDTVLFLHDLTDRTPIRYTMTFPANYNVSAPKNEGITCNTIKKDWYDIGVSDVLTPNGHIVKGYSVERTLCDLVRLKNKVDIQIITEAFKRYVKRKDKNIPLLSEYAKVFKVQDKVRSYLEVLL